MLLVPAVRASIRALQAENRVQYLCQETQYDHMPVSGRTTEESNIEENDRSRAGCLDINSVLFGVDLADHFGNFGSQREEVVHYSYYRYMFRTVVHLEENVI
jgi:hypothetical protein